MWIPRRVCVEEVESERTGEGPEGKRTKFGNNEDETEEKAFIEKDGKRQKRNGNWDDSEIAKALADCEANESAQIALIDLTAGIGASWDAFLLAVGRPPDIAWLVEHDSETRTVLAAHLAVENTTDREQHRYIDEKLVTIRLATDMTLLFGSNWPNKC